MSAFDVRLGDCLDPVTGMSSLEDRSVDVVLTDPPYSSGTRKEGQKGVRKSMVRVGKDEDWFDNDAMTVLGFTWMIRQAATQWRRVLVPGGHVLVFIDWRMYPHLAAAIETADLRHAGVVVWKKSSFGMGSCFRNQHEFVLHFTNGIGREPLRRDVGSVIEAAVVRDGDHPTEKPVHLVERLLEVVLPRGGLVLDPFAGSGTTGVAAIRLGSRFVGWEKDPRHCHIAARRISGARQQLALSLGDCNDRHPTVPGPTSPPTAPNPPPTSEPIPAPDGVSAGSGSALGTHGGEGAVGDLSKDSQSTSGETEPPAQGPHGVTGPDVDDPCEGLVGNAPRSGGPPAAAVSASLGTVAPSKKRRGAIILVDANGVETLWTGNAT